jgi:hypothetical protein
MMHTASRKTCSKPLTRTHAQAYVHEQATVWSHACAHTPAMHVERQTAMVHTASGKTCSLSACCHTVSLNVQVQQHRAEAPGVSKGCTAAPQLGMCTCIFRLQCSRGKRHAYMQQQEHTLQMLLHTQHHMQTRRWPKSRGCANLSIWPDAYGSCHTISSSACHSDSSTQHTAPLLALQETHTYGLQPLAQKQRTLCRSANHAYVSAVGCLCSSMKAPLTTRKHALRKHTTLLRSRHTLCAGCTQQWLKDAHNVPGHACVLHKDHCTAHARAGRRKHKRQPHTKLSFYYTLLLIL